MQSPIDVPTIAQALLRLDTTNPPGNEGLVTQYIARLLDEAGVSYTIVAAEDNRPNLIARLPGRGTAPPLLLYGHADVVTTEGQTWQHPPFGGEVVTGELWGRGALDMKGGLAMLIHTFLHAVQSPPAGDLLLAVLSDEEAGSRLGAQYLVTDHPDLFAQVRYAIGEVGGFSIYVGKQRYYTVMVAEKRLCTARVTVRGAAGHGAYAKADAGAVAQLTTILSRLRRFQFPIRLIPIVERFLRAVSNAQPAVPRVVLQQLLNPRRAPVVMRLLGSNGQALDTMLRHTMNVAEIRYGDASRIGPDVAQLILSARLLPGSSPEEWEHTLRPLLGPGATWELLRDDGDGPPNPDMTLMPLLTRSLRQYDSQAITVPFMLSALSDARFFNRLGIQTYGFLPMPLPRHYSMQALAHGPDERVPVESLLFGGQVLRQVVAAYG